MLFGHQHGAVAVPHGGATRQERVLVTDVGVGMNADGADVQFPARRTLIECLNILQNVRETETGSQDQLLGQPIKHKGVIGVRRMTQRKCNL